MYWDTVSSDPEADIFETEVWEAAEEAAEAWAEDQKALLQELGRRMR